MTKLDFGASTPKKRQPKPAAKVVRVRQSEDPDEQVQVIWRCSRAERQKIKEVALRNNISVKELLDAAVEDIIRKLD